MVLGNPTLRRKSNSDPTVVLGFEIIFFYFKPKRRIFLVKTLKREKKKHK